MDFVTLSHLRWNFVFQRPQHLMSRCARSNRVFFWEEPIIDAPDTPFLQVEKADSRLHVVVPHLPAGLTEAEAADIQEWLLQELMSEQSIREHVLWYYTPMARHFSRKLKPQAIVYDCMDELSAFRGAPPGLRAAEAELFACADLVFTGGQTLYESKKLQLPSVHCFPSSIDREFFETARHIRVDPEDQTHIPHPRIGYCGVIDERMDLDLLAGLADRRPDWQIVMLGPVVKISEGDLPRRANIHYVGAKDYRSLPTYFAGWDAGLLPFALNESTRFISPTKTPEYLAAGLPVVSTPITDVVEPYGTKQLVEIAADTDEFIQGTERAILSRYSKERLARADSFLSRNSWDLTWQRMDRLIEEVVQRGRKHSMDRLSSVGSSAAAD